VNPHEDDRDAYLPDAATIRRECERIRESWSPEVEASRRVGRVGELVQAYSVHRKQGRDVAVEVADLPR
jgi:hypothetical protein